MICDNGKVGRHVQETRRHDGLRGRLRALRDVYDSAGGRLPCRLQA